MDVLYDVTAQNFGYKSEQCSQIYYVADNPSTHAFNMFKIHFIHNDGSSTYRAMRNSVNDIYINSSIQPIEGLLITLEQISNDNYVNHFTYYSLCMSTQP